MHKNLALRCRLFVAWTPACFFCKVSDQKSRGEDLQVKLWNGGCKIKQERWYLTLNLPDRQTCLVALRYDDAVAGVSTDTVTHTLQQQSHLESNLRVQRCTQKHTVWGFSDACLQLPHLLEARMWQLVWGKHARCSRLYIYFWIQKQINQGVLFLTGLVEHHHGSLTPNIKQNSYITFLHIHFVSQKLGEYVIKSYTAEIHPQMKEDSEHWTNRANTTKCVTVRLQCTNKEQVKKTAR